MALPYRDFGVYFLMDLAETTNAGRNLDRLTLNGNQVSRQFILPSRGGQESGEDFSKRLASFKKDLPRGSDRAYRLAISHEAFCRAGEKNFGAAICVLDVLKLLPNISERDRRSWAKRGVVHKQIRSKLGMTQRGRRRKRKMRESITDYRQIESIRSEVSRYKSRHAHFNQAFEKEFSLYRLVHCRDAEFCAEEEVQLRELLNCCETALSPWHQFTAVCTINLARVLHEQRKFAEAAPFYWLGLARHWAARWAPHWANILFSMILRDIENCQNQRPPEFSFSALVRSRHLKLYHLTVDLPPFGHAAVSIDLRPKP